MQGAQPVSQSDEGGTKRFRAKRDAILAAAAETTNAQSAKGMTFADVARRVGLNTTSVTYYFKRKDDLAAACFEHTPDTLMAQLAAAHREPTPQPHVTASPAHKRGSVAPKRKRVGRRK